MALTQGTKIRFSVSTPDVSVKDKRSTIRVRMEVVQVVPAAIDHIVVSPQDQLPLEIFLYQRELADPASLIYHDVYVGVCALTDLAEFPTNNPDPAGTYQFFRKNWVDLYFDTWDLAQETMALIRKRGARLAETLDRNLQLDLSDQIWEPSPPDTIYIGTTTLGVGVVGPEQDEIPEPTILLSYRIDDAGGVDSSVVSDGLSISPV